MRNLVCLQRVQWQEKCGESDGNKMVIKGRLAIREIDPYRCTGCGVCVQSCMNDVIRMKRGKAVIVYQEDCGACFACEMDCPREAISFGFVSES